MCIRDSGYPGPHPWSGRPGARPTRPDRTRWPPPHPVSSGSEGRRCCPCGRGRTCSYFGRRSRSTRTRTGRPSVRSAAPAEPARLRTATRRSPSHRLRARPRSPTRPTTPRRAPARRSAPHAVAAPTSSRPPTVSFRALRSGRSHPLDVEPRPVQVRQAPAHGMHAGRPGPQHSQALQTEPQPGPRALDPPLSVERVRPYDAGRYLAPSDLDVDRRPVHLGIGGREVEVQTQATHDQLRQLAQTLRVSRFRRELHEVQHGELREMVRALRLLTEAGPHFEDAHGLSLIHISEPTRPY